MYLCIKDLLVYLVYLCITERPMYVFLYRKTYFCIERPIYVFLYRKPLLYLLGNHRVNNNLLVSHLPVQPQKSLSSGYPDHNNFVSAPERV